MNDESGRMLSVGRNCWRIERAQRLALIVDAADYFRHVKSAMLKAQHRIMLIGWDFDTRIKLEPEQQTLEGPNVLGEFLSWLPKHRENLNIHVLKWDLGMIQGLGRGMTPWFVLDWITDKRLHLRLDHAHPVGAAHHQKIVVIDDVLAFCGGIDMTTDRWDTPEHLDDNPLRTKPNGQICGPWHDATTAVDGDAARAIADLARERWLRGTGKSLPPVARKSDLWPDNLIPTMEHVDVAIARTLPELNGEQGVKEIESLYLDAIGQAKHTVYIETQYLASRRIADAMGRRLQEPDGPEIILVLPETTEGWLEHKVMDGARHRLLHELWKADRHQRFGVYYPVTAGGKPIYVHAKILTMDDRLLRVGSSNLNNRSMSFDTECDLAVEATDHSPDQAKLRDTIAAVRDNLVCEHLDVEPHRFSTALEDSSGSVLKAIEALRGSGRTLRPFDRATIEKDESMLAENDLLDPEMMPAGFGRRLGEKIASIPSMFRQRKTSHQS
ncbi:phospholipase D-like domain-containing protein [Bradyrhizobium sp.]|uniref:phospholipase D-like domain-containing protein n=1 Tax=Bradyrhizobium sp. TaxID=376 RepID=UPI0027332447|nr:phospholipase D-like domain-containing protein [Bradyrhizobium sp.]MDP3692892.1 phospholipase D-like domain-containing protein [Bradyrhizobium sp.]